MEFLKEQSLDLTFVNDLPDNVTSEVYMFADDTKMYKRINNITDHQELQIKWISITWTYGLRIGV